MKLNLTTDYALRIIIYLALAGDQKITSAHISSETSIPHNYLVKVVRKLRLLGYIESFQGINGGHKLIRDPASITLLDVLNDLEGEVKVDRGSDDESFSDEEESVRSLIKRCFSFLQMIVDRRLTDITIQSIIDKKEIK